MRPRYAGISAQVPPEYAPASFRNPCPDASGISAQVPPEYAVEDACTTALEMGVANYRFVRRYAERHPKPPLALRQIDPLIRELTHYRDHIDRMTKESTDEPG